MRFTKEALAAVGIFEVGVGFDGRPKWHCVDGKRWQVWWGALDDGFVSASEVTCDALLRLALAHPERAHLALGEGWEARRDMFVIAVQTDDGLALVVVAHGRVRVCPPRVPQSPGPPQALGIFDAPPGFDAALARARRIAAAWQRIRAKGGSA